MASHGSGGLCGRCRIAWAAAVPAAELRRFVEMFHAWDANGNGRLEEAELQRFLAHAVGGGTDLVDEQPARLGRHRVELAAGEGEGLRRLYLPEGMRPLLERTGLPQQGAEEDGTIGPFLQMRAAIEELRQRRNGGR